MSFGHPIHTYRNTACAMCGAYVQQGEHFYRIEEGKYACEDCFKPCTDCGAPDATTRFDQYEGDSDPLCKECWRRFDRRHLQAEADANIAWAERMTEEGVFN